MMALYMKNKGRLKHIQTAFVFKLLYSLLSSGVLMSETTLNFMKLIFSLF